MYLASGILLTLSYIKDCCMVHDANVCWRHQCRTYSVGQQQAYMQFELRNTSFRIRLKNNNNVT